VTEDENIKFQEELEYAIKLSKMEAIESERINKLEKNHLEQAFLKSINDNVNNNQIINDKNNEENHKKIYNDNIDDSSSIGNIYSFTDDINNKKYKIESKNKYTSGEKISKNKVENENINNNDIQKKNDEIVQLNNIINENDIKNKKYDSEILMFKNDEKTLKDKIVEIEKSTHNKVAEYETQI
jgi:hypothetical protein